MILKFLIFGVFGLVGALIFSATKKTVLSRQLNLTGEASLILFPVYGLVAFLYPAIAIHIGGLPWYGRGLVYAIVFYIVQYLVGLGLSKINMCPWQCSGKGSFGGLIRIQDAPVWFIVGLVVEWFYPYVRSIADMIGK